MSHGDNCGDKKNGCVHPHCESSGSTKPGMDREFADGWSAGADEVRSVNVRFFLDTDLLHPDAIQNCRYYPVVVSWPSPIRFTLFKRYCNAC